MTAPDLIARLTNAECGSRELDAYIHARGEATEIVISTVTSGIYYEAINSDREQIWLLEDGDFPHYTTSLDAALTLVPEGWSWFVGRLRGDKETPGSAQLLNAKANPSEYREYAKTPALALCIAALKAREAAG